LDCPSQQCEQPALGAWAGITVAIGIEIRCSIQGGKVEIGQKTDFDSDAETDRPGSKRTNPVGRP